MIDAPADLERPRPSRAGPVLAALVVLAVLLAASVLVWGRLTTRAHADAQARFEASVDQASRVVQSEIEDYASSLRDVGAYVTTAGPVSQGDFSTYIAGSGLFGRLPPVVGVLYLTRVPEADLDRFIATQRTVNPDFAIVDIGPAPDTDVHFVLTHYAPGRVDLQLPIGTDTSSLPTIAEVVSHSADSGDAVAASFQHDPIVQRLAERNQFPMIDALLGLDFFIGVPVYAAGVEPGPPNVPVGWVAATIGDFDDVADRATAAVADDVGLELTVALDGLDDTTGQDLSRVASIQGDAGPRSDAAFETTRTVRIDGVDWTLTVWSGPDTDDAPLSARLALAGGILGSFLAAGIVYVRLRARDRERAYLSEMAAREEFQREILDSVTNPMVVIDGDGAIVLTNPAWDELWRGSRLGSAGVGDDYLEVAARVVTEGHHALVEGVRGVLDRSVDTTEIEVAAPQVGRREEDRERWYAVRATPLRGRRPGAILIHTDVTERRRSLAELEVQAARDTLTGLVNRGTFVATLEAALAPGRVGDGRLALLFIDLDGFKPVNDTYGHSVGDEVLRAAARRIEAVVRASDTAARLGGDEFVVLIDPLVDRAIAEATADRILDALAAPIHTEEHEVTLGASIGVAVVDGPTRETAASLIRMADAAMYESKQLGGVRITIIDGDGEPLSAADPSPS